MDREGSDGKQQSGESFARHASYRSSWLHDNIGYSDHSNSFPGNLNDGPEKKESVCSEDKRKQKSVKDISREFALRTTSHGVGRIAEAGSGCAQTLWAAVVLIALFAFTGQLVTLIIRYLDYPVSINIGVVSNSSLEFPAVTICNNNKVRKSAILDSTYDELLSIDDAGSRDGYLTYLGPCIPGDVACDVNETQCVKSYMKCNGINDCPNGGDEQDCFYGECFEGEFRCPSGKCIPEKVLCDYRNDCGDNADEDDCDFPSCNDDEFACSNYQCISKSVVCNGKANCYDGSDEIIGELCLYPTSVCPRDYFRCRNGECVHYTRRCNAIPDCSDTSDEDGCTNNECPDNFFRCTYFGDCIVGAAVCDGKAQCKDTTDEFGCPPGPLLPNGCSSESQLACGDGRCIDATNRCDGNANCVDSSDEIGCNATTFCPPGYFTCATGRCILETGICNGRDNCLSSAYPFDRSDETNCEDFTCLEDQFQCDSGICISWLDRCNHAAACFDNSDEVGCDNNVCGEGYFRCDGGRCIAMVSRCDGLAQCGNDEDDCDTNICPTSFFTCNDGQCIPLDRRCDFGVDCNDQSDEINCTSSQCPEDYFRCRSGQCVEATLRCNNQVDCVDGYDEFNCTGEEPPRTICREDEFKCVSIETCVNSSLVCNGIDDCGDNSDESECSDVTVCTSSEFRCDGKGRRQAFCIPRLWLCDRINQCGDGSDESNCTYDVEDVFSDSKWKTFYSDITEDEGIFDEFVRDVYVNRNFDFVRSENPPSWNQFILASNTPDFTDLQDVLKLTPDELAELGHQSEDLILQCTYDQKKCNYSEFYMIQHDKYGNCFTFNHGMNNDTIKKARKAGADYGLKLTLFTEQNEYIGLFGQQSGVRVVVHHPTAKPFPEDEGVYVKPGAVTAMSLKMNKRTRMGPPHGLCADDLMMDKGVTEYEYTALACQKSCLQKYLFQKCGCVETLTDNKPRCSVLNKTQDACKQLMYYFYQASLLTCDCQQPCREVSFSKTISQALWPSTPFLPHLLNSIHATNRKTWVIRDKESAREDLVRLEVYFEDLNYNLVSEEEAYSIFQLLADTGGSLGLWVGLSLITVIEFLEFMVMLCHAARQNKRTKREAVASDSTAMQGVGVQTGNGLKSQSA